MFDSELKVYIENSLREGYSIDDVKKALTEAGHDLQKIEKISAHFANVRHDLVKYIEIEMRKGKSLDSIKNDLLNIGHHIDHVGPAIHHVHKKTKLNKGKRLFIITSVTLLVLFILLMIPSCLSGEDGSRTVKEFEQRNGIDSETKEGSLNKSENTDPAINTTSPPKENVTVLDRFHEDCNNLTSEFEKSSCLAIVHGNPSYCGDDPQTVQFCEDTYLISSAFYHAQQEYCDTIGNNASRSYCTVLLEDLSCDSLEEEYTKNVCTAIKSEDVNICQTEHTELAPYCIDAYYQYLGLTQKSLEFCQKINASIIQLNCINAITHWK